MMYRQLLFIFITAVLLLLPEMTLAQTSQKTATPLKPLSNFKMSGYIDGSYNYLENSNRFTSGSYDRVFDINQDGLTLQQTGITFAYQPKQGLGGLITPVIGRDTYIFAPYGWNANYFDSQNVGFAIPQAYAQYAAHSFTFMAGQFIELTGAENLFSYNDTNFSRSILWGYAEPFTVTGLRVSYVPIDKLTLIGGVNNGWDNIRDWRHGETLELGISYIFNQMLSLTGYAYTGQQRIADRTSSGPTGQRTLIDLIGTLNATKKLSFVINYDGALQTKAALPNGTTAEAIWQGIAGYINYKFDEKWRTSARGEIFDDQDGYRTGVAQTWDEATLTLGYTPIKNLELRAETRRDFSNQNAIIDKNGVGVSNNQQSYALEAVCTFS